MKCGKWRDDVLAADPAAGNGKRELEEGEHKILPRGQRSASTRALPWLQAKERVASHQRPKWERNTSWRQVREEESTLLGWEEKSARGFNKTRGDAELRQRETERRRWRNIDKTLQPRRTTPRPLPPQGSSVPAWRTQKVGSAREPSSTPERAPSVSCPAPARSFPPPLFPTSHHHRQTLFLASLP